MNKKIIWLVGIIIVLFVIVIATSKNSQSVIKIGVIGPFTGARSDAGESMKNALTIAEKEINSSSSLPKIKLIYEDSKYDAPSAVSSFNKLKDVDGVNYIIGPFGSSEVLAVAPIAEKAQTIIITPSAQTPEISQAGDYIFRTIHNTAQEAPVFATYLGGILKNKTLDIVAINTAISDPYIKVFKPIFETAGGKIGLIEKFDSKEVDFKTILTKIKANKPTALFMISTTKQAGLIIKQANEMGISGIKFYGFGGTEGKEVVQVAGSLADGLIYPYSYDSNSPDSVMNSFRNKYFQLAGYEPDATAANSYDDLYLIVGCLKTNGNNVDKVKACLYATKDYIGASGKFSIDSNGDAVRTLIIKTIKDGKFVKL